VYCGWRKAVEGETKAKAGQRKGGPSFYARELLMSLWREGSSGEEKREARIDIERKKQEGRQELSEERFCFAKDPVQNRTTSFKCRKMGSLSGKKGIQH